MQVVEKHKRTQSNLRRLDCLASIVRSSHDAIIGKTLDGTIASWNFAAEQMFGYTEEEICGRNVQILIPEDRHQEERYLVCWVQLGVQTRAHETIRVRKDGSQFPISLTISPIKSQDGQVIGASAIARDITDLKQGQDALRKKESQLIEAQRIAGVGSFILDIRSRTWTGSEVLYEVLGLERDYPHTGDALISLLHDHDLARFAAQLGKCLDCRETFLEGVFRIIRPGDRAERWISIRSELECDSFMRPSVLRGTLQDITARKVAEIALRESNGLLHVVIKDAPTGIAMLDRDMRYIAASDRWKEERGLTGEDISGRSHYELIPSIPQSWRDDHQRALAGQTVVVDEDRYEYPNGGAIWVRRTARPWHTGSGAIGGILLLEENITEQKRAEIDAREKDAQLDFVIQNLDEGLLIADLQGNILSRNRGVFAISGIPESPDQLRSLSAAYERLEISALDGRVLTLDEWPLSRVMRGEVLINLEAQVRRRDSDEVRIFAYSGSLVKYETGRELAFLRFQDITERKRAEESLREAQSQLFQAQKMEAIGQLAGGIAHDFNNTLSVILGYGEMLEERLVSDEAGLRFVRQILLAEERAAAITRQLLAFGRKQMSNPITFNLNAVVTEMLDMIDQLLRPNTKLITDIDPDLRSITADRTQLEQVFLNLCLNARDAMPNGGTLTICIANTEVDDPEAAHLHHLNPGPYVRVSITDTGCGMDRATMERAFEPFFTTKAPGQGTGLGLSTSYGIIQKWNGHICAESEVGKGSTFTIYLPSAVDPCCGHSSSAQPSASTAGSETIFVVDDEHQVRRLLTDTLRSVGYRVLEAEDAVSALRLVERDNPKFDLLLSDVLMPGMSGPDMAETLKKKYPHLKMIFLSGFICDSMEPYFEQSPETLLLQKPISGPDLLVSVRSILDQESTR